MKRENIAFVVLVGMIVVAIAGFLLGQIGRRVERDPIGQTLDETKPVVALTFDDGPNERYTPRVLDILYEEQVPATFFLVGEALDGNEWLVREMVNSGHELGNHTFSHPDLTTLDAGGVQREIRKTEETLQEILPEASMQSVRPPYGRYTAAVESAAGHPLALWTVDSGDWAEPEAACICETVVKNIQDRDIIVFHDDNQETVLALEKIITKLKGKGFQFVVISQLLGER